MGTSSARKAPVGKFWRRAKTLASRYASGQDASTPRVEEVVAGYLTALEQPSGEREMTGGGAIIPALVQTATSLAHFYALLVEQGWTAALNHLGVDQATAQTPGTLIPALLDRLAGPGARLEEATLRSALIDHLTACLATTADPYTKTVDPEPRDLPMVNRVLNFLGLALFQRFLSDLGESLEFKAPSVTFGIKRQEEVKSYILAQSCVLAKVSYRSSCTLSSQPAEAIEELLTRLVDHLRGRHGD